MVYLLNRYASRKDDNMNEVTHYRTRLVRTGSGTKLHTMIDRSRNNGETWGVGSTVYCGSSVYAPRTVAEATSTDIGTAFDALGQAAANVGVAAESCCRKCSGPVAHRITAIREGK
jgi:hypothetical protein